MTIIEIVEKGFKVKPVSSFEGDRDKYFLESFSRSTSIAIIDTKAQTLTPCHGFAGKYLKKMAKTLELTLVQ